MDDTEYKYDVAFSFLAGDEVYAQQLNDELKTQLNTFIYSERQKELAGTDGEETFNRVFGKEARIVVVLYRSQWGQTRWTRIEETAIRNRAMEEGYDFTVFIPLDTPPTSPRWLPKNRLWVNQDRWGAKAAAVVIAARVIDANGSLRQETLSDKITREARDQKFEKEKKEFLNSSEAVQAAFEEASKLFSMIQEMKDNLKKLGVNVLVPKVHGAITYLDLKAEKYALAINWQIRYSNTLDESGLSIEIWKPFVPRPGLWGYDEPTKVRTKKYRFTRSPELTPAWHEEGKKELVSTHRLAEIAIEMLIEKMAEGRR